MIVKCDEKEGTVEREVYPLPRRVEDILATVDKMQTVSNFLTSENPYDDLMNPGNVWFLVDDVGILGAADIRYGHSAHAHMTFWDGRLRGREELCKEVGQWIINCCGLAYLWTAIPKEMSTVLAFTKRIGFEKVAEINGNVGLQLRRS